MLFLLFLLFRQLPSITGFEERAACLEFDGGMSRKEANKSAAKEFGFKNPRELFMAINSWRNNIEAAFLPSRKYSPLTAR
jgi:hypothetical protein